MTDDIVTRLRENCDITDCVNVRSIALVKCDNCKAADEIERLRQCLQHAIDHMGKWQLFTVEEKQAILAEYEQAVRGER